MQNILILYVLTWSLLFETQEGLPVQLSGMHKLWVAILTYFMVNSDDRRQDIEGQPRSSDSFAYIALPLNSIVITPLPYHFVRVHHFTTLFYFDLFFASSPPTLPSVERRLSFTEGS